MVSLIHRKVEILMTRAGQGTSVSRPRWDGNKILFELDDHGRRISCAISRGALEELGGLRYLKSAELLRCFAETRGRIETIALGKLRARPECVSDLLRIWTTDLDDAPPAGAPMAVR